MLVVCGILDLQNPAGNRPGLLFINSQGFMGIDDFTMLCIKDVPYIIKDNNLVPNKEARLGAFKKRELQALVLWAKDFQHRGLAITSAAWTTAELTSSITHINIDSPSGGDNKVVNPGKLLIGHKRMTLDDKFGELYWLHGRSIGYSLRLCDTSRHANKMDCRNEHDCLKDQAIQIGPD